VTSTDRYRFVILAPIISSQLMMGMSYMCISPLFPMIMNDFQINRATVSLLISSVSLIMAIFTIPGGIIAAKIGIKRSFGIGTLLMAAGVFTYFTTGFTSLLAIRIIYGIGVALRFPTIAGLVMQWFKDRELTIVNASNLVGMSAGVSIGMVLVTWLAMRMDWEMILTIFGAALLFIAVVWLFLGKERATPSTDPTTETKIASSVSISAALKQRTTWMLVLCAVGPMPLWGGLNSWLPTYYTEVFKIPLSTASSIVGLFNLLGIPACILGGILAMRTGLRKPFFIIPGIIIGFAAFGTFLFNNLIILYICAAVSGLCIWIHWPTLMTVPMELPWMTPKLVVVVIATVMGVANSVAFVSPLLIGYLADTTGSYTIGFSIWALLSWSLLVGGLLLPETGPRAKRG
jgi:ACS family D-galactonate transporter-like MFS transporter